MFLGRERNGAAAAARSSVLSQYGHGAAYDEQLTKSTEIF